MTTNKRHAGRHIRRMITAERRAQALEPAAFGTDDPNAYAAYRHACNKLGRHWDAAKRAGASPDDLLRIGA